MNLPPGDFLKKGRFELNKTLINEKKEKLANSSVLREFRTELARKRKLELEDQKYKNIKRFFFFFSSFK